MPTIATAAGVAAAADAQAPSFGRTAVCPVFAVFPWADGSRTTVPIPALPALPALLEDEVPPQLIRRHLDAVSRPDI